MQDEQLDNLFKKGLDKTVEHSGKEYAWEQVENRLGKPNKNRRGIIFFFGLMALVLGGFLFMHFNKQNNNLLNEIQERNLSEQNSAKETLHDEAQDLSSLDKVGSIRNIDSNSINEETNQEQHIKEHSIEKAKELQIVNKGNELKKKEKCNCPDDDLEIDPSYPIGLKPIKEITDPYTKITKNLEPKELYEVGIQNDITNNISKTEGNSVAEYLRGQYSKGQNSDLQFPEIQILNTELNYTRSKDLILGEVEIKLLNKNRRAKKLSFTIGLLKDYSFDQFALDSTSISQYYGIAYSLNDRFKLSLEYSSQNISRSFEDGFDELSELFLYLPDVSNVLFSNFKYRQKTIDLSLQCRLISLGFVDVFAIGGAQWFQSEQGTLSLSQESTYISGYTSYDLSENKLALSTVISGVALSIPILKHFSIDFTYLRQFELKYKLQRRASEHRLKLGISINL